MKKIILLVACLSFFALAPAGAHDHAANMEQHAMPDAQAIEHLMKKQFDKPDAPLTVAPVTTEGQYAVAGWVQSGKGGRALLKKENGTWQIQVCGGKGLTQAETLTQTGMPPQAALTLAQKVGAVEAKLSTDQRKKLDMFEGMMKVDAPSHDGHAAHHKH